MKNKRLVVISGAGISAESGLKTFRGENGLWEGYDVMKVASIEGWRENPELVLNFYNLRRAQLKEVEPNEAHRFCAKLEDDFHVDIITQNVDDLHERGGSTNVLHLHGSLKSIRSTIDPGYIRHHADDLFMGDLCPKGGQLRPDIVWFGEAVPLMQEAAEKVYDADVVIIVGTSMQVYPAASLVGYARDHAEIFYIDPEPQMSYELNQIKSLKVIQKKASDGMSIVYDHLISE